MKPLAEKILLMNEFELHSLLFELYNHLFVSPQFPIILANKHVQSLIHLIDAVYKSKSGFSTIQVR